MIKVLRIVVSIIFVLTSIVFVYYFVNEKLNTDNTVPVITVKDEIIDVSLHASDEELLAGVSAYDEKDKDLTDKVIVESISRFVEKGVSKVTYAVCDSDNNVATATRKIRYKDYASPRFFVNDSLCFSLYDTVSVAGKIGASDCIEGNITRYMIMTTESFTPGVEGVFYIDATVTNSKGDTSEAEIPFIVEDRSVSAPKIELSEYLIYVKPGTNPDFKSYLENAFDYAEKDLTSKVVIETNADLKKEGTHLVHYYATDDKGQRGHTVLTVIVGN